MTPAVTDKCATAALPLEQFLKIQISQNNADTFWEWLDLILTILSWAPNSLMNNWFI